MNPVFVTCVVMCGNVEIVYCLLTGVMAHH